jgi:hypothetical protein
MEARQGWDVVTATAHLQTQLLLIPYGEGGRPQGWSGGVWKLASGDSIVQWQDRRAQFDRIGSLMYVLRLNEIRQFLDNQILRHFRIENAGQIG